MSEVKVIHKNDIKAIKELIEVMERLNPEEIKMMLTLIKGYSAGIDVGKSA
jgi:hypothetical protein